MFSKVIADAKEYTRPVVTMFKFADGKVFSSVGTYIHIDDLGHILSAKHIFTMGSEDPIEALSVVFDQKYFRAEYVAEDVTNDLVLLKINDYKSGSIKLFPKFFKSTDKDLLRGTDLVRLGYPNSNVDATWNEISKSFVWVDSKFSFFDNSGVSIGYEVDSKNKKHLLATNFPARIGQSGGPVLTTQGLVAGIQSKNSVFEIPGNRTLEIGIAASHVAIAGIFDKCQIPIPTWVRTDKA